MTDWFQQLAISLGLLLGLVQPAPNFQETFMFRQNEGRLWLSSTLPGAGSPEVTKFLTGGYPLVLQQKVTWGKRVWIQERTLSYDTWKQEFTLTNGRGELLLRVNQPQAALEAWGTFRPLNMGTKKDLEPWLRTPLRVLFELKLKDNFENFDPMSLWGYSRPEGFFLFFEWSEVPG